MSHDWTVWNYSPSLKGHTRYYDGNPMAGTTRVNGVVEKHGEVYRWAIFRRGEGSIYGDAASLAAAKRAADRAEIATRLAVADAELAAAQAAVVEIRARRDAIAREVKGGPRNSST